MVSSVNPLYSSNISLHELEVLRRLQSLGVRPSGNLLHDRQILQRAEFKKLQSTLSVNNADVSKEASYRFSDTLYALNSTKSVQENSSAQNMTGATQVASLNRFNLGI